MNTKETASQIHGRQMRNGIASWVLIVLALLGGYYAVKYLLTVLSGELRSAVLAGMMLGLIFVVGVGVAALRIIYSSFFLPVLCRFEEGRPDAGDLALLKHWLVSPFFPLFLALRDEELFARSWAEGEKNARLLEAVKELSECIRHITSDADGWRPDLLGGNSGRSMQARLSMAVRRIKGEYSLADFDYFPWDHYFPTGWVKLAFVLAECGALLFSREELKEGLFHGISEEEKETRARGLILEALREYEDALTRRAQ